MELRKTWRKLTTALSRFWHREAGPMNSLARSRINLKLIRSHFSRSAALSVHSCSVATQTPTRRVDAA